MRRWLCEFTVFHDSVMDRLTVSPSKSHSPSPCPAAGHWAGHGQPKSRGRSRLNSIPLALEFRFFPWEHIKRRWRKSTGHFVISIRWKALDDEHVFRLGRGLLLFYYVDVTHSFRTPLTHVHLSLIQSNQQVFTQHFSGLSWSLAKPIKNSGKKTS